MATKNWTGGSSSVFATAANWSDAAAPADDDIFYFDNNSVSVDGAATGMDNTTTHVGPNYSGTIGSSAAPLNLSGTTTPNIVRFNGLLCPASYWSAGNVSGNTFYVYGTSGLTNACNIAGVWTDVFVLGGNVVITGTITTLHILSTSAIVTVSSGATVTTVNHRRGNTVSAVAHTTVNVWGGEFKTYTLTAVTVGTANVNGGTYRFHSRGGTISTLVANGGLTSTVGQESVHVITAGTVNVGATLDCNPGTTGTITQRGGKVFGSGLTTTPQIDEWSGGVGSTGG